MTNNYAVGPDFPKSSPQNDNLRQSWQTSSLKGEIPNISGFANHRLSVSTSQLCSQERGNR